MGMAKEQAQLQNRANLRQYNYDMKQFEAQRADLERRTELTNKVQDATFEYQQQLRNIERLSILDQYEKSNDQYKQQLRSGINKQLNLQLKLRTVCLKNAWGASKKTLRISRFRCGGRISSRNTI